MEMLIYDSLTMKIFKSYNFPHFPIIKLVNQLEDAQDPIGPGIIRISVTVRKLTGLEARALLHGWVSWDPRAGTCLGLRKV